MRLSKHGAADLQAWWVASYKIAGEAGGSQRWWSLEGRCHAEGMFVLKLRCWVIVANLATLAVATALKEFEKAHCAVDSMVTR